MGAETVADDGAGAGVVADAFSVDVASVVDLSMEEVSAAFSAGAAAEESVRPPMGEVESDVGGVAKRCAGAPPTLIPASG
ncbi:hypothetical protein MTX35_17645 [Rhodococcus sp. ARC_M12]|uniref:hypothetical protein n=1 Tax=Rhodococcus sp. ARC_M12 TaxID=2928854 RepID=UPI001FB2A349|nr:hypothetical protein [Rhodococcus sp. ARC_M12]MCJ0979542.1 hypothetical protein [Rhodococcus sp. ARC_M12]